MNNLNFTAMAQIADEEIEQAMVYYECDRETAIAFLKADNENRDYLLELENSSNDDD